MRSHINETIAQVSANSAAHSIALHIMILLCQIIAFVNDTITRCGNKKPRGRAHAHLTIAAIDEPIELERTDECAFYTHAAAAYFTTSTLDSACTQSLAGSDAYNELVVKGTEVKDPTYYATADGTLTSDRHGQAVYKLRKNNGEIMTIH